MRQTHNMKKTLYAGLLATALLMLSFSAGAQITREKLEQDIDYARGVYHPYVILGDTKDTPAPKGYKPFYISHYGRHGSRYHTWEGNIADARKGLKVADSLGILTSQGKKLQEVIEQQVAYSDGMWGQLTEKGGREHEEIASRMYKRFRPVWTQKDRRQVNCLSSHIQRCMTSMAYSTHTLGRLAPGLDFDFLTGERYFKVICPVAPKEVHVILKEKRQAFLENELDYMPFYEKVFNSPKLAAAAFDPYRFCYSVYLAWDITESLDACRFDILDYMDIGEVLALSRAHHNHMLYENLRNDSFSEIRLPVISVLVKDFLDKADKALENGSNVAADLRYGHDTGLMPLLAYLGLDGYDLILQYDTASRVTDVTRLIPMASNLQIVFYKSSKSPAILVKFLVNECETHIPALQPVSGPYYSWEDVRKLLVEKIRR